MKVIVFQYTEIPKKSIEILQKTDFLPYSSRISWKFQKYLCLHIFQQVDETPSQNLVRVILIICTYSTPKMGWVLHCQHG